MGQLIYCKQVFLMCLMIVTSGQATHMSNLRSLGATVTGSSQHSTEFAWSHAVDGSTRTDSGKCQCCAATYKENNPWMKIDLGRLYRVSMIEVTRRTDWTDPFEGMHIYLHMDPNWQHSLAGNITIPRVTGSVPYYDGTFEDPVIARFVTLQLLGNEMLAVCEVSIYSSDCHSGHFGASCGQTCGHCLDNEVCDHVTGVCTNCEAGYTGADCKDECKPGRNDCSFTCGQCAGTCDNVTGLCLGDCLPGYQGKFCKDDYKILRDASVKLSMSSVYQGLDASKAVDNVYDDNTKQCKCCSETQNGDVSWWQAEFDTPQFIKQIKIYGKHDENILRHLTGFKILLSMSGVFSEEAIYVHNTSLQSNMVAIFLQDVAAKFVRIQRTGLLSICEVEILQSGIRCPINTYGHSCTPCGYCKNGTCEQVTGHCPGGCDEHFDGDLCLTLKTQQSTLTSMVVGGAIGMTILIVLELVIVGAVGLIRWRKRATAYEEPTVRWNRDQSKDYATLDLPELREARQ